MNKTWSLLKSEEGEEDARPARCEVLQRHEVSCSARHKDISASALTQAAINPAILSQGTINVIRHLNAPSYYLKDVPKYHG